MAAQQLYWVGNAAKTRVIAEILEKGNRAGEPVTVFDYGCGDGGDWPAILGDHPWLRLIGYEPYLPSFRRAQGRLKGHAATILGGNDVAGLSSQADYIVSFSVFEHVVDRRDFLHHAKRILAPGGLFFLNYDDGHFRNVLDISRPDTWMPAFRAWARTQVSGPLAMLGYHSHYQRRVGASEANALVQSSGFQIERVDYHNLACLKELAKAIPENLRQRYGAWWLEVEKTLNAEFTFHLQQEWRHGDDCNLWQQMPSRTLCLRHV